MRLPRAKTLVVVSLACAALALAVRAMVPAPSADPRRPSGRVLEFSGTPADAARDVSTAPTLGVVLTGGAEPAAVRFYIRRADGGGRSDFTLIEIPDTQYYASSLAGATPGIFHAQTAWIAGQRDARNIAFVTHLGDCVEHGDEVEEEWLHVNAAMSRLERAVDDGLRDGIPYGVTVGNHDQSPFGVAEGPTTVLFNRWFGPDRFAGRAYYGGHFGADNDNHYDLFSAGGLAFIAIHFEYDPTPDPGVLAWADSLLVRYANRRAILVSHHFINEGNPGTFSPQGRRTFEALSPHPNVFLMLSGHVPGEGRRVETVGGRDLHMLLSNYQGRVRGGDGWLRILEFSPAAGEIRVRTYSPTRDEFEADSSSQFTIPYDMSVSDFVDVGEVAASSGAAQTQVMDLMGEASYEWYVTITDAAGTRSSPTWRFTTRRAFRLKTTATGSGLVARWPNRARYDDGSTVTITAVEPADERFTGWTGDAAGLDNPLTLTMTRDLAITASFTPRHLTLSAPAPHPSAGPARIHYTLARESHVVLRVHDSQGRAVSTLVHERQPAGRYQAVWNGHVGTWPPAEPGIYFVVLESGGQRLARRIVRVAP